MAAHGGGEPFRVRCCQCQVRVADQAERADARYGFPEEQADTAGGGGAEGQAVVGQ